MNNQSNELNRHWKALELDKILEKLAEKTSSETSRARALDIRPYTDRRDAAASLARTADINSLTNRYGTPSLGGIHDWGDALSRAKIGARLSIPELIGITRVLKTIRNIKDWRRQCADPTAADFLFEALTPDKGLEDDIDAAILNEEQLADGASPALAEIRRKIRRAQLSIRERLDQMIRSPQYAKVLQESIVTIRDGRFVVPVRAECKSEVKGLVHDTSSSGATVFVEPMAVVEANNEIRMLEGEEQQEIERILLELSGRVGAIADSVIWSFDALCELDLLFAKSRLADEMRAVVPELREDRVVELRSARHPLIPRDKVVSVDIFLGKSFDTLVITGPNTGGKTVALKTLGLLCLMAACGLMIPAATGSGVPIFSRVLADIGDEQSIEQSLSTFSAHITNIIDVLEQADENSLVLTDELGAGTDPVEGAALAVAILEAFRARGALMAATTHYAEIKMYALTTPGVENGSCEFDVDTLSPTYRLLIGVPGRSNAFAISRRLGLPEPVIERARELVSSENARFEDVVDRLEQSRQALEKEREAAEGYRREAEALRREGASERERLEAEARRELDKAREDARTLVERVRSQTDLLLNELEELKKQKDKEDFGKKVSEMQGHYKKRMDKLRDAADPVREHKSRGGPGRPPKSGDTVLILELGTEGTVLSGPDSSGNYAVQAGIIKMSLPAGRLQVVDTSDRRVTLNGRRREPPATAGARGTGASDIGRTREAGSELDIRGMASDEGIIELDRFIDRALLAGLTSITIIHGKGTGVLRAAVQDRLRRHSRVKSFRPGVYGEGEAGVTIAELK